MGGTQKHDHPWLEPPPRAAVRDRFVQRAVDMLTKAKVRATEVLNSRPHDESICARGSPSKPPYPARAKRSVHEGAPQSPPTLHGLRYTL